MNTDQVLSYLDERRCQIEDDAEDQEITQYELGQIDMIDELFRYIKGV